MFEAVIHAVVLSFGLILPLGAQNIFIFNQGAAKPRLVQALPAVLTACLCDTILILLAVCGVSVVILTFHWIRIALFAVGIVFLLYMGWSIWKTKPSGGSNGTAASLSAKKQISFAASVSLLNPHAILDTVGVIGTSSISYAGGQKVAFCLACIAVSWVWFFSLACCGKLLGRIDTSGKALTALNKISAVIVWGVAVYMLQSLVFG